MLRSWWTVVTVGMSILFYYNMFIFYFEFGWLNIRSWKLAWHHRPILSISLLQLFLGAFPLSLFQVGMATTPATQKGACSCLRIRFLGWDCIDRNEDLNAIDFNTLFNDWLYFCICCSYFKDVQSETLKFGANDLETHSGLDNLAARPPNVLTLSCHVMETQSWTRYMGTPKSNSQGKSVCRLWGCWNVLYRNLLNFILIYIIHMPIEFFRISGHWSFTGHDRIPSAQQLFCTGYQSSSVMEHVCY